MRKQNQGENLFNIAEQQRTLFNDAFLSAFTEGALLEQARLLYRQSLNNEHIKYMDAFARAICVDKAKIAKAIENRGSIGGDAWNIVESIINYRIYDQWKKARRGTQTQATGEEPQSSRSSTSTSR